MANSVIPLYYLIILLRKVLKAFLVLLSAVSEAPFNVKIWGRLDFMVFQSFAFDFKVWAFIFSDGFSYVNLKFLFISSFISWTFSKFKKKVLYVGYTAKKYFDFFLNSQANFNICIYL